MYRRPKIPTEMRKIIFEVYEHKCLVCGEGRKYRLQIHHLDKIPSNNDITNLLLVCYECHAYNYHPEKAFEMIEWFEEKFIKNNIFK